MVYMYHSFLIHPSADGHLGCFHVLAIITSVNFKVNKIKNSVPQWKWPHFKCSVSHMCGLLWQSSGLRLCTYTAKGTGSIPGQGTKILYVTTKTSHMHPVGATWKAQIEAILPSMQEVLLHRRGVDSIGCSGH